MNYKLWNTILGWCMFFIALLVYILTIEPTVSLWDCGEFISAADKLQVVHPPGAPLFLMVARLFIIIAPAGTNIALVVNAFSALCSALTVLFTFWITSMLCYSLLEVKLKQSVYGALLSLLSGVIASMSLTFSDTFWFSAVEAEVYAFSSFFTAMTFWAALKWYNSSSIYADKWLLLIAYFTGLSIGGHLLSLLTIPSIAFLYYFKYHKMNFKGLFYTMIIGLGVLFFVQNFIIPGIPLLISKMELLFVNSMGFGFDTGTVVSIILIVIGIGYGIYYFGRIRRHPKIQLILIGLAYIVIGYSSYAMIYIRSHDQIPIDMNNPEEPFSLKYYINREQYEQRPLLYGPYFNAPAIDVKEGEINYRKDDGQYLEIGRKQSYIFEKSYNTFFPRMGDMQKESSPAGYRYWSGMADVENEINQIQNEIANTKDHAEKENLKLRIQELKEEKPKMSNNLRFFFDYQLNHMYFRYFMWNFSGRQNDKQGHIHNRDFEGNWISGVPVIDRVRLGPQDDLPQEYAENPARNKFYLLPLILGVIGAIYQFKKDRKNFIVTGILFAFTGVLIIVFLNQPTYEPRERDYVHVGSFQVFCMWIGIGIVGVFEWLRKRFSSMVALILSFLMTMNAPLLMAFQGWDDHDRSGKTLAHALAVDILYSLPDNAVYFANADNDTYPVWYAQNVEGVRKDVRVINQNLLPTDWYSMQMLDKVYDSKPLPLSFEKSDLKSGVNDYFQWSPDKDSDKPVELKVFLEELKKSKTGTFGKRKFFIRIDRSQLMSNPLFADRDSSEFEEVMQIEYPAKGMHKGDLVLLDLIARNAETGWKRPICFSTIAGSDGLLEMEEYMEKVGMVYHLVPIRPNGQNNESGKIDEERTYKLLMEKFEFGGMKENPDYFMDDKAEVFPSALQQLFTGLSVQYLNKMMSIKFLDSSLSVPENKEKFLMYKGRIEALMAKCQKEIPYGVFKPSNGILLNMSAIYHEIEHDDSAKLCMDRLWINCKNRVVYFKKFINRDKTGFASSMTEESLSYMKRLVQMAKEWNLDMKLEGKMKELKALEVN